MVHRDRTPRSLPLNARGLAFSFTYWVHGHRRRPPRMVAVVVVQQVLVEEAVVLVPVVGQDNLWLLWWLWSISFLC